MELIILIAVIAGLPLLYILGVYNALARGKVRIEEALSEIDNQLKRRYDLIPNLIETVKGYAKHEKKLLKEVTEARARAQKAGKGKSLEKSAVAESALSHVLGGLMVQVEAYPDLKANKNFLELQNELSDTENKIQAARRFYNSTVQDFNTKVRVFPSSIVAKLFKYKEREFFEIEEAQKEKPKVSF